MSLTCGASQGGESGQAAGRGASLCARTAPQSLQDAPRTSRRGCPTRGRQSRPWRRRRRGPALVARARGGGGGVRGRARRSAPRGRAGRELGGRVREVRVESQRRGQPAGQARRRGHAGEGEGRCSRAGGGAFGARPLRSTASAPRVRPHRTRHCQKYVLSALAGLRQRGQPACVVHRRVVHARRPARPPDRRAAAPAGVPHHTPPPPAPHAPES